MIEFYHLEIQTLSRFCTSHIKVEKDVLGKIKAYITYTHYGHDRESHPRYSWKRQRQEIAAKIGEKRALATDKEGKQMLSCNWNTQGN